jgi:hypothetical protein
MQSYYPWNTNALTKWLKQELNHHEKQHLEAALHIQRHVIRSWLSDPIPTITLAQIHAIADYRSWPVNQVIDWLELRPGHVQELASQNVSAPSSRNSWR